MATTLLSALFAVVFGPAQNAGPEQDPSTELALYLNQIHTQPQVLTRVLALTQTSSLDEFMQHPTTVFNFNTVHDTRYVSAATMLLKLDPRLNEFRMRCVPARQKESVFWRNYLSRVLAIIVEDQENQENHMPPQRQSTPPAVKADSETPAEPVAASSDEEMLDVMAAFRGLAAEMSTTKQTNEQPAASEAQSPAPPERPCTPPPSSASAMPTPYKPVDVPPTPNKALDDEAADVMRMFRELSQAAKPKPSANEQKAGTIVELLKTVQKLQQAWDRKPPKPAKEAFYYALQAFLNHHLSFHFPSNLVINKFDGMALRGKNGSETRAPMVQFLKRNIAGFASMTEEALIDAVGVGLYEGGDSDMHWIVNVQADRSLGATNAVSLALVDVRADKVVVAAILGEVDDGIDTHVIYKAVQGEGSFVSSLDMSTGRWSAFARVHFGEHPVYPDMEQLVRQSRDIKSIEKVKLAEQAIKSLADDCTASSYVGVLSGSLPVFYLPPSAAATPFQALDHAAGILLIQEADLAVTDLQSKPIVFREGRLIRISKSILAAPASLQSRLVEAINKVNNPPPLPLNVTVRKHFVDPRVVRKAIADALGCAVSDVDVSLL